MRILGVDCGSARTGFGVIDSDGRTHQLVTFGTIVTSPRESFPLRLLRIATGLRETLQKFQPDAAAVEEVFHAANAKTALKLSHVRGVALLTIAEAGLTVGEYSPMTIKMSVVGTGRAEKEQVQLMVRSLLRLPEPVESPDAADALAVAICHAVSRLHLSRSAAG